MYAIIRTGGKQYRVQKGDVIDVEKITPARANQKTYKFDEVLLLDDDKKVYVGAPTVANAQVEAKIVEQGKHRELLEQKGYYYRLYTRQYEDEATFSILGERHE